MKRCVRCQVEKPTSEFSRDSRCRDGLYSACKACIATAAREKKRRDPERLWRLEARTRRAAVREALLACGFKACGHCRELVPMGEFSPISSSWCKACKREAAKRYREENREQVRARNRAWAKAHYVASGQSPREAALVHGHSSPQTPTYNSWDSMLSRCYRPSSGSYRWYGGRGIEVCERWKQFKNFLTDMGERPKGKTLDRIDPNGDYEPSNCRWATSKEQHANKRESVLDSGRGK